MLTRRGFFGLCGAAAVGSLVPVSLPRFLNPVKDPFARIKAIIAKAIAYHDRMLEEAIFRTDYYDGKTYNPPYTQ